MAAMRRLVPFAVAAVLAACTAAPAPDATGAEIFDQLCARCHGAGLEGGVGPALGPGSAVVDRPDEYIVTVVTRGQGRMPSFGGTLSEEQVERVVAYLRERQAGG